MPAQSELLNRRQLLRETSGVLLLPNLPDFPDSLPFHIHTEQREATSDVLLLGQQVAVDNRGKVTVSNLYNGAERQVQLPIGASQSVAKISPNSETVAIWSMESGRRHSTLFALNLVTPNASPEKLGERSGDDAMAYIRWSPDNQWVWINHGSYQQQIWELFNLAEKKQYWSEYFGGGVVSFSPNGRWMLEAKPEWRMLFDLQTTNVTRWRQPMTGSSFDTWSPDSSRVAFITTDGKDKNLLCITNIEANQLQVVGTGSTPFGFSPDNRFFVYLESDVPTRVAIFDTTTGRKRTLANLSNFYQGAEVLFLDNSRFRMVTHEVVGNNMSRQDIAASSVVNAETGQIEEQKRIRLNDNIRLFSRYLFADPPLFTNSDWISGVSLGSESPTIYAISLETSDVLKTTNITSVAAGYSDTQLFVLQQQTAIRTPKDIVYLPKNGKLYQLAGQETTQLLQVDVPEKTVAIPRHIIESLPQGETLGFALGDIVSTDEKTWWYLRNNKRYPIADLDKFIANSRFDKRKHFVPDWALQSVEVGYEPVGEKDFFKDYDDMYKTTQKDGGRMILFISGYDTNSEKHADTWDRLMYYLVVKGWKYTQYLNGTYNVEVDPYTSAIVPQEYKSEHAKRYPPENSSRFDWLLTRYKMLFPRTKFILVGHSLGGYMAFHLAQQHMDAVETVITLGSPLKGLDRVLWNEYADTIAGPIGKACGEYLVALGDNPDTVREVEMQAIKLTENGVRLFTFANEDDWFVRKGVALLDGSLREQKGKPVQLLWQLGHDPINGLGDYTEAFTGHGQILRDAKVIETIVSILA